MHPQPMEKLCLRAWLEDHLTFGAGYIPSLVLVIPVFFPFVFGLIRFQDVRAPYGPLSSELYLGITLVALFTSYLLLRQVGRWTFASSLHRRRNIVLIIGIYVGAVLGLVLIGYLITNPRFEAIFQLGLQDVIVGFTVATVYVALLSAVILRQDLAGLFEKPEERFRHIEGWLDALAEARATETTGEAQVRSYERLIEESEELMEELEGARTNQGERLRRVFNTWLTDFRDKNSTVSREAILTGDTGNDRLKDKYQTLTWVRRQVASIGGDEVGKV